jgi:glycosyltransferase involved in cell wall biosynthesis
MSPFFSIIIPALNEEKYLPKLLRDLTKQSYQDFEVLLVDGKSQDQTVPRAHKVAKNLPMFSVLTSKKRNVSFQRNLGASNAKGAWYLFMDADNRLPDYFLDGIRYRIAETKCDCFTTYCEPDTDKAGDKMVTQSINAMIDLAQFLEKPSAQGAMIGVTKEGFEKIGGFDTEFIPSEDKLFVRTAVKKSLNFQVFKDPKYIFSMRRYNKTGHLKTIGQYLDVNLQDETKGRKRSIDEYKMGGHIFKDNESNQLADLQLAFDEMSKEKTFKGKMEVLLSLLEK